MLLAVFAVSCNCLLSFKIRSWYSLSASCVSVSSPLEDHIRPLCLPALSAVSYFWQVFEVEFCDVLILIFVLVDPHLSVRLGGSPISLAPCVSVICKALWHICNTALCGSDFAQTATVSSKRQVLVKKKKKDHLRICEFRETWIFFSYTDGAKGIWYSVFENRKAALSDFCVTLDNSL